MIELDCEVFVGKSTRGIKEFTREQKLSKENKQLKKELAHLRKQISRLDGDRVETLREMVADQEEKERFEDSMGPISTSSENLKKDWACNKPNCSGYLEIVLYTKLSLTHYYRKCSECFNRTGGQRYNADSVKGILKNV